MKAFTASLVLCAVAAAHAAQISLSDIQKGGHSVVDQKYIIEVANPTDLPTGKRALSPHAHVYNALRKKGVKFKVAKEFNAPGLFVGASVNVESAAGLSALMGTASIVSVRPVQNIPRPAPVDTKTVSSQDDPAVPADFESTHKLTGVDKLHAEGNFGLGVKIGIIDTGIDYTHPALGGGFGVGFKVAGGYDLVGDAYTGFNNPVPDNDPLDQCAGHGTHVAGIIGADPITPFNISGVAYKSSIYSYRVFGCSGSVQDDVIVDALLRGFNDGMDVLTLSLGGVHGWTETASADVASKIAARGKIVTVAAGNDGAYGSWYTSSPGTGLNVISVASTDNTVINLQSAVVSGVTHDPINYNNILPLPIDGTHPVYVTSTDNNVVGDACNPLASSTPDLSNYVVLIRRGSCAFTTKMGNAAAFGAKYFLVDNNVPGYLSISIGSYIGSVISPEDGQFLRNAVAAGQNPALTFPQTKGATEIADPSGGLVSAFTTYGPTFDMYFKPALAAPGGSILSTYPTTLGTYAVLSGTSMATPFMAGVSALLFAAKGKDASVGLSARDLFQTTASPVAQTHDSNSLWETLTHQGAGLVQAYKAIHAQTIVSPGQLLLNDTRFFQPTQKFKITNKNSKKLTYTIAHIPAGTAQTLKQGSIFASDGPVPLVSNAASVAFSQSSVSIAAGKSATIIAHFSPPQGLDSTTLPAYSGWITITSPSDSSVVSYLGVVGSLYEAKVIDNTKTRFGFTIPALLDSTNKVQTGPVNYTFVGWSYPTVLYRLAFGTRRLTFDLVDASIAFNATLSKRGSYAGVRTSGNLMELDYQPRNSDSPLQNFNGYSTMDLNPPVFSNGTKIPNGSYKILIRALRVTGNPKDEADYESWLSPIVNVQT